MLRFLKGGSSKTSINTPTSPDDIPLHIAIKNDDSKSVKKLVDGAVGGEVAVSKTDKLGRNAIHIACDSGRDELLRILLKSLKGAPRGTLAELVNAKDNVGATPVFLASQAGSRKCVSEILKAGADVTVVTAAGESVLHAPFLAPFLAKGHTNVLKELLMQPGLKINALDGKNVTPLQMACRKGAYDCACVLLAANADATMVKGGEPPLFSAAIAENPALIQKLLEHGADIAQPNSSGQTLMELLNPKCEIYRVIKRHLINRPGGARKLQLFSEEAIVATSLADLPPEVLRLVERAGLPESEISAHWPVFCSIIQSVAKKTIVATAEEAATAREQRKQKNQSTDAITREVAQLSGTMITSGEPSKIFKKMRVAGSGGFGMVFQGTGPDKKQYAIKRMPHSSDKEKLANLREANFLKNCNHKNICAYKATYESAVNHELWLIMELLEGGTLDESIGKQSEEATHFFEERHLAYTAAEILQGLEYLHENHVVHRDLKSQNVMFTLIGDVKIIDFGSAVSIADPTIVHKDVAGSPFWMSPEMILHKPHGPPTDIWSMAVCLQELANHRPPDSSSILRHMFRVATGNAPSLDKPEKWSDLMRDFLDLCMQHDPTKRPRATVLMRHKWVSTRACSQTDMAILLRKIFYARNYNDV